MLDESNSQILVDLLNSTFKVSSKGNRLLILLGCLGDFDSMEYIEFIANNLDYLKEKDIDVYIIGIGDNKSKKRFIEHTKLPQEFISVIDSPKVFNNIGLLLGSNYKLNPRIKMLLMCMGFNSKGTLKEVLRGYTGDKFAKSIFKEEDLIKIGTLIKFRGSIFNLINKKDCLRPFELATKRLVNLIEVITHWNTYYPNEEYLTQRGATFLLNNDDELVYSFYSKGILNYCENKYSPLFFADLI